MPKNKLAEQLGVPVGTMIPYASGASIPGGFLACDGSTLSRTAFANLFAAIGTEWGSGDGATTFHIPDLRGRFLRGHDDTAGRDPDAVTRTAANVGGATGDSVGSVQGDTARVVTPYQQLGGQAFFGGAAAPQGLANGGSDTFGGNETRSKNANVKYIIKVV